MSLAAVQRRARPFGLTAAVLVALLLSACGSSTPTLNTITEERAIAASILTQHHLHAAVRCPSNPPRKAGFTFTCTAKFDVGTYPVTVSETNGRGHVRYQDQNPLVALDIAKVEQSIRESISSQRRLNSTVACPTEVLQKAGIVFTCIATVSGRGYPFAVTEVDDSGHVRYVGQ
jgi:hypothetical protein